MTLHVRWLATVPYREAHVLQRALFDAPSRVLPTTLSRSAGTGDAGTGGVRVLPGGLFPSGEHGDAETGGGAVADDWLLLLEHPHVFTLGTRGDPDHVLVDPTAVGAELVRTDRGGDVTYHGPGQLVGYPILSLPGKHGGGMADTVAHVGSVQQLIIDTLVDLGLREVGVLDGYPGVWADPTSDHPRKIAAIGVRLSRGRSMHGFALNVDPDLDYFSHIVPCGIADKGVTSLAAEGIDASMREVVDALVTRATQRWVAGHPWERMDVAWNDAGHDVTEFARGEPSGRSSTVSVRRRGRLDDAGIGPGLPITARKPDWIRAQVHRDGDFAQVGHTMRDHGLVTVCEEAGCPNIFECWSGGTATFMINGDRCTRACSFCLVDTRRPAPLDPTEPERVAEAVATMQLDFAVVTSVARDDLDDGGASGFVETIRAIRTRTPDTSIEVLIPDCRGDRPALASIFEARPDVLNHNVETVPRLQRAVRPSASYARSLAVLASAKTEGLTTKSGLIVGMGESDDEVVATLADMRGVGVDIVTIGQYLRPTRAHVPVARWVEPATFAHWKVLGERMGIGHLESSPLTRSSYHAQQAVRTLAC